MQVVEAFYFRKLFEKAYYDTMHVLLSDNFEKVLLEAALITAVCWVMKISQQDAGVLT